MATFINYGEDEDDAIVQGAEWLKDIIQHQQNVDAQQEFMTKFKDLREQEEKRNDSGAKIAALFDLFLDCSADVFASIPEPASDAKVKQVEKVESYFALVFSMLLLLEQEDHLDKATTRLCDILSGCSETVPDLRLRLLMMLYNTFQEGFPFRYRVFKHVLDYSAKANMFDQCIPVLEHLDSWMVDWELSVDDKRTLFRDIATYMRQVNKRVDAFLFLKRFHGLYQGAKAAEFKDVHDSTVQFTKDAVQLPSVIQFDDILSFDTVKALDKTGDKELVGLCKVFLSGTVQDFRDFHKKNGKLFDQHELSFNDALSKIRLLSLASLSHGKSELSLEEVAAVLEEKVENIEEWVVKAISEGFIDGRIDQLNHKVLVKSAFQRKFEKEEWQFLDDKLTSWIGNLEDVIMFIGKQKQLTQATTSGA